MKYVNASNILPDKLLAEIQKYVQGETLYIPKPEKTYRKWGTDALPSINGGGSTFK
ncbi:hypothetical protein RCG19_20310 [Neobacillus sp. OS1-2]|uniref:hypothetical protein n=1 Tax=Neobacillus sp. OS1-2 TaxID=3070680 RepID=UPI0027E201A9|nr:hypothetical protein [Neobacillus sp. OS1-2]WML42394.1 hypothetical protein RCG19_20310 [Neobacillus sp. OS1-2]